MQHTLSVLALISIRFDTNFFVFDAAPYGGHAQRIDGDARIDGVDRDTQ
jgi:hypothetical protein